MPGVITNDDANYALEIVQAICTEVGPGLPGSSQEWERAMMIKKELESHLGTANVLVEEFAVAPWAFLSAYPLSALFMLIAVLLNISVGRFPEISLWATAAAALAFSMLSPLPFIFEFILGFELLDPFFKQKRSLNVVGTLRKPGTKTLKRLLILSGHHDSAPENTWLRFLGYGFFALTATWFLGFITLLVMSTIQLAGTFAGNAGVVRFGTLGWGLLIYPMAPAILFGLFFNMGRQNGGTVPGAADNLSGSALAIALCRFLVKNTAYIPDDTEIRFISFGSEEAGCRGSRRYVERHLDELKRLDARLLNFETVACPEVTILTSEKNGLVKNAPEIVNSVIAAAQRAGVAYKVQPAYIGVANDAGPFSQAGLKATTLLAFKVPQQMVAFYHQKWDRPEIVSIEPLINVLKLSFEWAHCGGEQADALEQ